MSYFDSLPPDENTYIYGSSANHEEEPKMKKPKFDLDKDLQKLYYSVMIICAVVLTAVFSFRGFSQPMLNSSEIVGEYILPENCLSKKFLSSCSEAKISVSIWAGNVTDKMQATAIYRLSGNEPSKIGGQVWYNINDYFKLGWETAGSLGFDFDHELFGAFQYNYGKFTLFPFASMHLQNETLGSLGAILYLGNNLKVGMEYIHQKDMPATYGFLAGVKIDKEDLKEIIKILGLEKIWGEEQEKEDWEKDMIEVEPGRLYE